MVDLELVKQHLRVDGNDEDLLIEQYTLAAYDAAIDYLNVTEDPDPLPPAVQAAILLGVADLYEDRQGKVYGQPVDNATYKRLLDPYRLMDV